VRFYTDSTQSQGTNRVGHRDREIGPGWQRISKRASAVTMIRKETISRENECRFDEQAVLPAARVAQT